ncbi:helix-turn-helix domain-containing protein [Duganella lactea]|uniref:helix-turn-helix domain-containing protein n=1 Tax=Duganella lactea TaxID=2692173 RepID=UPI00353163CF
MGAFRDELAVFLAAVETGSFSAAGRRLNLSPASSYLARHGIPETPLRILRNTTA